MVSSNILNGQLTINVDGNFDFSIYKSFRHAYTGVEGSVKEYVVNLSKAEYMDSSALGMLLLLREYAGGDSANIQLVSPNPDVLKVLNIANFQSMFTIS